MHAAPENVELFLVLVYTIFLFSYNFQPYFILRKVWIHDLNPLLFINFFLIDNT